MRKEFVIWIGTALAIVLIGAVFFVRGTRVTPSDDGPYNLTPLVTVPFSELAHGSQSTVTRRTNYLITSPDQLRELWKMIDTAGQTPTVDFAQNDVIAVFAGTKPTVGYAIAVTEVADEEIRTVTLTLTEPGGSCLLAQSLTAPYQVIVVAKTTLPLTHADTTATVSCLR
ncbi:protease complex subunit PrcB family protein [Candidatus Kaiserbacteria bacterium]|nr:protease complex subunit PrcB family protein [Candidatus Kaiserbacteria bacterium]